MISGIWGSLAHAIDFLATNPAAILASSFLLALIGRILASLGGEYVKLWWFKGIPPWRAHDVTLDNIEHLDRAFRAREVEIDAHRGTINAALTRAEDIGRGYLVQKVKIAELQQLLAERESEIACLLCIIADLQLDAGFAD